MHKASKPLALRMSTRKDEEDSAQLERLPNLNRGGGRNPLGLCGGVWVRVGVRASLSHVHFLLDINTVIDALS